MAGIYKVAVFDSRIASMFGSGTDADAFVRKNVGMIRVAATLDAPKRSGTLAAHHKTTGPYRVGAYHRAGQVYNDAKHAEWVHNGTYGPIYPKFANKPTASGGRKTLKVPWSRAANRVTGPFRRKLWVDGQKANPWLERAAREVISRFI